MSFLTILIDFIHLSGMMMWIGALWYTFYIFYPITDALDPPARMKAISVHAERFPKFANPVIGLVVLTGLFNTFDGKFIFSSMGNFSPAYNAVLGLKMLVVLAMIALGMTVGMRLSPQAMEMAPAPGEKPTPEFLGKVALIKNLTILNLALGFVLLFLAAALLNNAVF